MQDQLFYSRYAKHGVIAVGKSPNHVATTQECSDCHTTASFVKLNADGNSKVCAISIFNL